MKSWRNEKGDAEFIKIPYISKEMGGNPAGCERQFFIRVSVTVGDNGCSLPIPFRVFDGGDAGLPIGDSGQSAVS